MLTKKFTYILGCIFLSSLLIGCGDKSQAPHHPEYPNDGHPIIYDNGRDNVVPQTSITPAQHDITVPQTPLTPAKPR